MDRKTLKKLFSFIRRVFLTNTTSFSEKNYFEKIHLKIDCLCHYKGQKRDKKWKNSQIEQYAFKYSTIHSEASGHCVLQIKHANLTEQAKKVFEKIQKDRYAVISADAKKMIFAAFNGPENSEKILCIFLTCISNEYNEYSGRNSISKKFVWKSTVNATIGAKNAIKMKKITDRKV